MKKTSKDVFISIFIAIFAMSFSYFERRLSALKNIHLEKAE